MVLFEFRITRDMEWTDRQNVIIKVWARISVYICMHIASKVRVQVGCFCESWQQ
jgi:hypothetical protein